MPMDSQPGYVQQASARRASHEHGNLELASQLYSVTRWNRTAVNAGVEMVAEEVPVALVYNGISHAVMLATPQNLEDFALGFSLAEAILAAPNELYDLDIAQTPLGIEVRMQICNERMHGLKHRRRNLAGRTGCGLCGMDSLQQFARPLPVVAAGGSVEAQAIHAALSELGGWQSLHEATGAVHAAGLASLDGHLLIVREDVGRHNALDKLLGAMARHRVDPHAGFVVVTSRASYEMVQKAVSAGVCLMAAISSPTGLAVRLAEKHGLTLAGFARHGKHVLYAHPERVRH